MNISIGGVAYLSEPHGCQPTGAGLFRVTSETKETRIVEVVGTQTGGSKTYTPLGGRAKLVLRVQRRIHLIIRKLR